MKEITQFQFDVLAQFAGIRAATDRSLARAMRCELVMIKSAIAALLKNSMIIIDMHGEITLAPAGVTHLNANGVTVKKPKEDSMAKLEALDLPPSNQTLAALAEMTGKDVAPDFYKAITEGDNQLTFDVRKSGVLNIENGQAKFTPSPEQEPDQEVPTLPGVDQIVFSAPTGDWGKVAAVAAIPAEERPDFATLVRNGLERLNKQLGRVDVEIENIDLKIETLAKLSASVEKVSAETAAILRDVSKDLHRIRYNYTGDDARSSK
jgi:hypothetical protein